MELNELSEDERFKSLFTDHKESMTWLFTCLCDFECYLCDVCGLHQEAREALSQTATECLALSYGDTFGESFDGNDQDFMVLANSYITELCEIAALHAKMEKVAIYGISNQG